MDDSDNGAALRISPSYHRGCRSIQRQLNAGLSCSAAGTERARQYGERCSFDPGPREHLAPNRLPPALILPLPGGERWRSDASDAEAEQQKRRFSVSEQVASLRAAG